MFLHLTFQEYLTACALARRLERKTSTTAGHRRRKDGRSRRLPKIWEEVDRNAWLPEWHEVLILLAGILKEPVPLLELLTDELCPDNKPRDDVFRHRLALAACCLPELPAAPRQTYTTHVDRITTTTFGMWWEHHRYNTGVAVTHLSRALPALGQVNGRVPRTLHHRRGKGTISCPTPDVHDNIPLQQWLAQQLGAGAEVASVRAAAVEAVERLGSAAATEPILVVIVRLLQDPDAHFWAAALLGRLGSAAATEPILMVLARLLQDADVHVRRAAAMAVGRLGSAAATEPILVALVPLLQDTDVYVRQTAVEAVGRLGSTAATESFLARIIHESQTRPWDSLHDVL